MADEYIADLRIHPAAQLFPGMGQADLNKLHESVKLHGVLKPIILYKGDLVDGRNRVRAALMCGIPWTELPKVNLPADADPYQWAWMMNCERLDYTPAEKARIRLEIENASAGLETLKREARESANRKRSEAAKAQHAASSPRAGEKSGRPPSGGRPDQPDPRKNAVAAKLAAEAGVSQRTMERVMGRLQGAGSKRTRLPKKQASPTMWRLPRSVPKMAAFLRQNMPSDEIRKLVRLLSEAAPLVVVK